ncbi:hypothetical protein ACFORF_01270, partial [Streptococcus caprae]
SLFIIGHMGLFFYIQKGSIISAGELPTTEIIEPKSPENAGLYELVFSFALKFLLNCQYWNVN